MTGIPTSWDSCTAVAGATSGPHHAAWSPCGRYIASGSGKDIEVRDPITLEVSYVLKPTGPEDFYPDFLAFSLDGHLLVCAYVERRLGLLLFPCTSILMFFSSKWISSSKLSVV